MQKPRFPLWHIATPSYRQRFSPCFRRVKLVCMGFLIHCYRVWLKGLGQLVWDWFICGRWPKENLRHWQNKWMLRNDRGVDISLLEHTMIFRNPTNEVKSLKDTRYFFLHGLAWSPLNTSTRKGQTSSISALFGKGLKRNFCFQRPSSRSSGHMSHMRRGAHQRIW